ncbi:TonB-dependent receptor [Altererythrobacter arenosus]|uniref:TonB-dependent receptor n=1 Tax=Altererythrobacter arenosus TaxID=3032592 RepID=A0ABY8FS25_9SPHN|nr:TonB-dependent receptor [Altererythrobacter sp. CAU 1644]WFL77642.1 TonB-dependent receptor [Altererythrobacter sp. CAU 1644]
MTIRQSLMLGCAFVATFSLPLRAQQVPAERGDEGAIQGSIVVTGERLRGQLDVEQAPVLELNAADIEAVGATSVTELLEAIAPQTGSSRGRGGGQPVFLVNGIRIGSFRELRSYPPEAIAKVEVLPEEVAQRFGFPPDRRVVNMILKENYSSREIELEFEGPSRGGYFVTEQEATLLTINDGARLNINAEIQDTSLLTEAERGVIQTPGSLPDVAGDPDPADYRSLVADGLTAELTANWAKALIESGTSLSLNASYEREQARSLSGLNSVMLVDAGGAEAFRTFGVDDPLERRTSSDKISASGSMNRRLGDFDLTTTFDAIYTESETEIDRRFDTTALRDAALAGTLALDGALPRGADAGFDVARGRTITGESKATLVGRPIILPAGEVSTSFDVGLDWKNITSSDTRTALDTDLTRRRLDAGTNITVPIAERGGAWGALGDLSLNLGAGFEDLSDFGTLYDWSAGLTWGVTSDLTLTATYIMADEAPSLTNLGAPQVQSFNVPIFDFTRGETVLATVLSGGNPDLLAEQQRDWKFSANWELPFWKDTRFSAEYIRNRSSNVTRNFPALTDEIEAAFPDRVVRDGAGQLVSLDRRPVTFARTRSERLVFGLSTRGNFGAGRPEAGDRPSDTPPREGRRRFGGGDGPPNPERRAAFMRFRERVCAEDGLEVLVQFAEAAARGEDLSASFPDFDPERAARMLERMRSEDGTIDRDRIAQFRERICSFDPSRMGQGRRGDAEGQAGGPESPRGRRGPGGGPGGPGGFGRDGRGRYFVNLTHTIELDSTILIADGLPVLDVLAGEGGGGIPRHKTSLEAGIFRNGKGMRLSARYTGKETIDGGDAPGASDLTFGDLATVDLRVFFDLGRLLKQDEGFLKNFRVSFRADNVFDARRRVTDENGEVPLSYQPALIDPTGRYIGIDLRKMF